MNGQEIYRGKYIGMRGKRKWGVYSHRWAARGESEGERPTGTGLRRGDYPPLGHIRRRY
jgi:hypothetical protein